MQEQMEARLASLKEEFEKGQGMLRDAELQRAQLAETLVRISGAIQVLEELLGRPAEDAASEDGHRVGSTAA